MSHYSVAVFTKRGESEIDQLLEPYDENKEVPHYITREELISRARHWFEYVKNGSYAQYLSNPEKFKAEHNESYVTYLTGEFEKKLLWNDEDFYKSALKDYDPEQIMPDGTVFSTVNPMAKWDWWYLRPWEEGFPPDGDRVKNIDKKLLDGLVTYAVVTPDGVWHAPGEMGWFACSTETDEEWNEWSNNYKKRFIDTAHPDWFMYLVDCHI